ncbi:MAG: hypothetical protein ABIP79_03845 [Chitinophagaceae bacterium]
MKKLFVVLAIAGVMTSCEDKKAEDVKTDTTETKMDEPKMDEPKMDEPKTNGVPTFSDADVQAYANSYADLAEAYKKAAETKDMSKFADLSKMGQDLATKAAAMSQKLATTPDEAKKLSDFIMLKSNEIMEASKKITGQ